VANLPDLDSSVISFITYWDVGVVIEKADVVFLFESYTEYDNGIEGTYILTGLRYRVRVRTDGLIVAYMLRADESESGAIHSVGGTTNASRRNVFNDDITPNTNHTHLYEVIDDFENAVTTAGKIIASELDLQYYDYSLPAATHVYVYWKTSGAAKVIIPTGSVTILRWGAARNSTSNSYTILDSAGALILEVMPAGGIVRAGLEYSAANLPSNIVVADGLQRQWSGTSGGSPTRWYILWTQEA